MNRPDPPDPITAPTPPTAAATPPATITTPRGFPLFAEVLAVGLMIAVSALGIVTALGALAAGCTSLREYLEHERPVGPRRFASLLREALSGPVVLLAPPALAVVAGLDVLAWRAGMPGGRLLGPAALAVILAAATVAARAAAAWRPTTPLPPSTRTEPRVPSHPAWPQLLTDAARDAAADWRGSALLAAAIATCAVLGWELPVLLPVLPGLLALAAVTTSSRRPTTPRPRP
ncbi:MAG TPA: hypothetical protein VFU73_00835 [Actinocrinis sp.]|nr:hypothetical protein [Actinocrinis sp.]